jgi:hypothetical protein
MEKVDELITKPPLPKLPEKDSKLGQNAKKSLIFEKTIKAQLQKPNKADNKRVEKDKNRKKKIETPQSIKHTHSSKMHKARGEEEKKGKIGEYRDEDSDMFIDGKSIISHYEYHKLLHSSLGIHTLFIQNLIHTNTITISTSFQQSRTFIYLFFILYSFFIFIFCFFHSTSFST